MPIAYTPKPIKADITFPGAARQLSIIGPPPFVNVYQNTNLRPMLIVVAVQCLHAAAGDFARGEGYIGPTNAPFDWIATGGHSPGVPLHPGNEETNHTLTFMVQPGWWYRVAAGATGASTVLKNTWMEVVM